MYERERVRVNVERSVSSVGNGTEADREARVEASCVYMYVW